MDNWARVNETFQRQWIKTHIEDAATAIKKPLLLEEFGKWVNLTLKADVAQRDKYFKVIYDETEKALADPGNPLKVRS